MIFALGDLMISPYRRMGYGEMKRVTQFDIYLLGTVRCLSRVKAGDRIDAHRESIILSYIGLNGFSNNPVSVSSLPGSVKAAKDLLTQIGIGLNRSAVGSPINEKAVGTVSRPLV